MRKLPDIDFIAAWKALAPSTRDAVGVLVLKEAFLRFAAGTYEGDKAGTGVAYLTPAGRSRAEREADEIAVQLMGMIQEDHPDLFGRNPTPENPKGTDPTWARPIVFRVAA